MDKKEAEEEAMRKAKQAHNAAGKNTGMSGRDLVRHSYHIFPHFVLALIIERVKFQYNPEWFEDEDEGDASEDWDLERYRSQKEADDLAAEEKRIADLALRDGVSEGDAEGSGGGRE